MAEPTNADYARAGYWSAIGRDNDYRIAHGGCIRGNEADQTWIASWPTLVPAGDGTRRHGMDEIGGDECGDLLPGDENLPLSRGAEDPDLYHDLGAAQEER